MNLNISALASSFILISTFSFANNSTKLYSQIECRAHEDAAPVIFSGLIEYAATDLVMRNDGFGIKGRVVETNEILDATATKCSSKYEVWDNSSGYSVYDRRWNVLEVSHASSVIQLNCGVSSTISTYDSKDAMLQEIYRPRDLTQRGETDYDQNYLSDRSCLVDKLN